MARVVDIGLILGKGRAAAPIAAEKLSEIQSGSYTE